MATQKKFVVKNGLIASDLSYPTADGTANQTMVTDGAGNLSFGSTGISETVQMLVKNVSGGSLTKGTPIHQTGTSGQHSEVIAARADTAAAMPSVGVLAETLADEAEGYAVITGRLSNIDTSSYSEGDVLFVGATGGLTSTKPTGESNVTQNIGIVNKVHASSGSITIYGSGRGAATPNLDDGNIFIGNSSNQSVTSTLDTSIVPENSNLYYTTARADSDARNAISATDAGGDGSFTYNTSTGTFTYTGPSASEVRAHISGGTGIDISSGVVSTTDGEIVHDSLSGFVANEHVDHSGVTLTAGNGLTGGGTIAASRTFTVGEGTGISVSADAIATNDAEIVHDNLSGFVADEHVAHSGVTLTAGDGLTGGGTIASSRTFAVGAGTGVTVNANDIAIGQDVSTTATPTFGNITTTGYIRGPSTFTIDPAAHGDNTGTLVVAGNLQVDGTTTTINSTTVAIDDLNITLASGAANAAAANGAGITVDGASATITYDATDDEWDFNKDINVTGTIVGDALDIDNINIDGSTISGTSGISLNGGGGNISIANANLSFPDNKYLLIGTGNDLQIYHDGTNSYIEDAGTGELRLRGNAAVKINQYNNNEAMAIFNVNGSVDLRYDNSTKLETTSTGVTVTGAIQATAGATSAPTYSFNGDSNTGISRPTSDAVNIVTAGVERVRIDGSGRLGLKTSANASFDQVAGANLFVLGSGAGDQGMTIYTGNTGTGSILFADGTTTSNQYEGYIQYVHSDNRLLFGSNHATRMTIDASGKVGIGTSTPGSNHAKANNLVVGGGSAGGMAIFNGTSEGWYAFSRANANNTDSYDGGMSYDGDRNLKFHTNAGNTRMTIDGSGNVGIGTTDPSGDVTKFGGSVKGLSVAAGQVAIAVRATSNAQYVGYLGQSGANTYLGGVGGGDMFFQTSTSGLNRMTIKSGGDVGIGTTSPATKLHVTRSTSDTGGRTIYADGTQLSAISTNGTNYLHNVWIENRNFDINSGVTDSGYRIGLNIEGYHDSNVFEGTLATQKNIWSRNGNNSNGTGTITNSYNLHLETLSGGGLTITNNYGLYQSGAGTKNYFEGNVGIGTTSPSTKLHVNGNIRASTLYQEGGDSASSAMVVSQGVNTTRASVALWAKDHGSYPGQVHIVSHSANASADSGKIMFWDYNGSAWNANGAWDKDGNLGVGTTSPGAKLHVNGASTRIQVSDSGTSFTAQDFLSNSNAVRATIGVERSSGGGLFVGSSAYAAVFGTASNGDTQFATNNNIRMTINSSGKVGINNSSPSYMLDTIAQSSVVPARLAAANGDAQMYLQYNTSTTGQFIGCNSSGTFQIQRGSDGTTMMAVDSSGSVGIGTTTPIGSAQRLYIDHPASTQTALPTVKIRRANNVGGGSALPEIALDVSVPSTYNNATEVYGIKTYAAHNLTGTGCFGIYAEVEKGNGDNHHAGFFRGGHSDTNGISIPKVVYIDQTTNVGASNTGYSIGCMIKQDDYTKNEFMRWETDYSGSQTMNALRIRRNNSQIGGITTTTSGTTYNTTSDRRLKDNIQPIADATDKLMDMKPVTHTWIDNPDEPQVHGFVAQEMQEVIPEAVSGDAESDEMMSMDYGRITPIIVAALQDALKEIKELKTRIDELEAK